MKGAVLACSIPLLLIVWNYQKQQTKQEPACGGKAVPVSTVEYGSLKRTGRRTPFLNAGPAKPARLVFRERGEFEKFWEDLTRLHSYKAPAPEVDFSREMLIVAAMGSRPSSGYEIIVESACEVDNQLEVLVRSTDYSRCGLQLGIVIQPLDMGRLPRSDLPVVFKEVEIISDCKELKLP